MSFLLRHERVVWLLAMLLLVTAIAVDRLHQQSGVSSARFRDEARRVYLNDQSRSARPLRVLFVGNSLTESNNLPEMIAKLARAAGEERNFEYRKIIFGGFGLSEHIAANRAALELRSGTWDAVVLQEQGQRPGWRSSDREAKFFAPARQLDSMIRAAGSKTVFYMTFARTEGDYINFNQDTYEAMQKRLIDGYETIAKELKVDVAPVGKVWFAAWRRYPEMHLWAPDGMHPSVAGTYLAACTFYTYFYQRSPVGISYTAGLTESDALAIKRITAEVVISGSASESAASGK